VPSLTKGLALGLIFMGGREEEVGGLLAKFVPLSRPLGHSMTEVRESNVLTGAA